MKYNRSLNELQKHAVMWWPEDIADKNKLANILPYLLKTQDKFLSTLILADESPEQIFSVLDASKFSANLFIKHLAILADYGGELMKRLGGNFRNIFPKDENGYFMEYFWKSKQYKYYFKSFGSRSRTSISNNSLYIDQYHILIDHQMTDAMRDMIMILLHASNSTVADLASLSTCEIGNLLGNKEDLEHFIKQRYIIVSKIISGCKANDQGQIVQSAICDYLRIKLGPSYDIVRNGKLVIDGYDKDDGMPFDIVVSRQDRHIGIEVSFQVTTNSTIERKSGQAASRQTLMHNAGYHIAYILDGAGNFQRTSAVSTICEYSDCTIAYSEAEFDVLIEWIKTIL